MKAAVELFVKDISTVSRLPTYDPNALNIGTLFEKTTGANYHDCWVTPFATRIARPFEQSVSIPAAFHQVIPWNTTIDMVFYCDGATATTTRRFGMYEFNKVTFQWAWKGFITCTHPQAGSATLRGFRFARYLYTKGQAACAGTTSVTGVGATWGTDRIAGGARIGFGTTDPTAVTTWYELAPVLRPALVTTQFALSSHAIHDESACG